MGEPSGRFLKHRAFSVMEPDTAPRHREATNTDSSLLPLGISGIEEPGWGVAEEGVAERGLICVHIDTNGCFKGDLDGGARGCELSFTKQGAS